MKPKSKNERLRSAAIVKLKYQMLAGRLDDGFKTVFDGVLKELDLTGEEVDAYTEKNREELAQVCLAGDH
jgi:hypothetical protein